MLNQRPSLALLRAAADEIARLDKMVRDLEAVIDAQSVMLASRNARIEELEERP